MGAPARVTQRGSGLAGPFAARGDGQICLPFVLGFGNWRACLKTGHRQRPNVITQDTEDRYALQLI